MMQWVFQAHFCRLSWRLVTINVLSYQDGRDVSSVLDRRYGTSPKLNTAFLGTLVFVSYMRFTARRYCRRRHRRDSFLIYSVFFCFFFCVLKRRHVISSNESVNFHEAARFFERAPDRPLRGPEEFGFRHQREGKGTYGGGPGRHQGVPFTI